MWEILIMVAATAGLYFLVRGISSRGEQISLPSTPQEAAPADADPSAHPEPVVVPGSLRQQGATPLQVRAYYFAETDANTGPADPDVFFDDITLDIYDPRRDQSWTVTYGVATPQGIARQMRQQNWDYLAAPDLLVVPRYNIQLILKALMNELEEQYEVPLETPQTSPLNKPPLL